MKTPPSDNGGEFTSKAWSDYIIQQGIQHIRVPPDAHAQNGRVERVHLPSSTSSALTSLTPASHIRSGKRQPPTRPTLATAHPAGPNQPFQMTSGRRNQIDMTTFNVRNLLTKFVNTQRLRIRSGRIETVLDTALSSCTKTLEPAAFPVVPGLPCVPV